MLGAPGHVVSHSNLLIKFLLWLRLQAFNWESHKQQWYKELKNIVGVSVSSSSIASVLAMIHTTPAFLCLLVI